MRCLQSYLASLTYLKASMATSKPAPVTADTIAATALEIAKKSGLESISFRNIAAELHISPMTIYKFIDSKETLLDQILLQVINRMEIPYSSTGEWKSRIIDIMIAWQELLLLHPYAVQILVNRRVPAGSQGLGRLEEHVLAALEDGGITNDAAVKAFWQIFSMTLGQIVVDLSRAKLDRTAQELAGNDMANTARNHGFTRVERLAARLADTHLRGNLAESLATLLAGIYNKNND